MSWNESYQPQPFVPKDGMIATLVFAEMESSQKPDDSRILTPGIYGGTSYTADTGGLISWGATSQISYSQPSRLAFRGQFPDVGFPILALFSTAGFGVLAGQRVHQAHRHSIGYHRQRIRPVDALRDYAGDAGQSAA